MTVFFRLYTSRALPLASERHFKQNKVKLFCYVCSFYILFEKQLDSFCKSIIKIQLVMFSLSFSRQNWYGELYCKTWGRKGNLDFWSNKLRTEISTRMLMKISMYQNYFENMITIFSSKSSRWLVLMTKMYCGNTFWSFTVWFRLSSSVVLNHQYGRADEREEKTYQ